MAAKYLEVAVILSAVDRMSTVIRNATGNGVSGFNALANSKEKADAALRAGLSMGAGAAAGVAVLTKFSDAFGEAQEAQLNLRASMMGPNGLLNEGVFSKLQQFSVDMSAQFAGSQKDYVEMIRVMKENRLQPEDILGGIGKSVSELSELFVMPPKNIGLFAARMKNDMRVPAAEMEKMVDLMARLKTMGVGTTGAETVSELTELFSKAGLGATNLRLGGVKDAADLGVLGGVFLAKGIDAASVGTTFRRILDNVGNPKKLKEMNEEAAKFGKHLRFFDKKGDFAGIDNFVAQLSTLKSLKPSEIGTILGGFGSKQGMGASIMQNIAEHGLEDYVKFQQQVSNQADLHQKVHEIQKGYNQQLRITGSNVENLSSSIGKSYNPAVTKTITLIGELAKATGEWVERNQTITAMIAGIVAAITAMAGLAAAIQVVKWAWLGSGMGGAWRIAMVALAPAINAIGLAITNIGIAISVYAAPAFSAMVTALGSVAAVVGAVAFALVALGAIFYQVYTNWDYYCREMKKSWQGVKEFFTLDIPGIYNYQVKGVHTKDSQAALANLHRARPTQDDFSKNKIGGKKPSSFVYSPVINMSGTTDEARLKKMLSGHADDMKKKFNVNDKRREF